MSQRESELLAAADKFIKSHKTWSESQEALLTADYEDALVECVQVFSSGDLPGNCRALASRVAVLAERWSDYERYVTQASPMPKQDFWLSVEHLIQERAGAIPEQKKPLEPVALLLRQKVTPRQIAVIYSHNGEGPFLKNGIPQEHLVYREAKTPGSVIPEGWVHPSDQARIEESRKIETVRIQRMAERNVGRRPCPESIEELLRQKVFPNQIAAMHGVSVEEVLLEAQRLSIPTEQTAQEALDIARQHNPRIPPKDETEHDLDALETDEEFSDGEADDQLLIDHSPVAADGPQSDGTATTDDLKERIIGLAESGLTAAEVADQLGCSVQKAASVIRHSRKRQEMEASSV